MATRRNSLIPQGDQGRPVPPPEVLAKLGAKVSADGTLSIPPEALDAIRANRVREATTSQVPSTPRLVHRNGGGVGVQKGMFRWDALAVESLRRMRERSPLVQAIHRARQTQVQRLSREWPEKRGEVGWRVVHKDYLDPRKKVPDSIRPFIATAENLIRSPSPRYCPTTGSLFAQLEDDYLTINRPVVERLFSTMDRKYVVGIKPVDGGLIWPTLNFLQRWMAENPRWYGSANPTTLSVDDALAIISESLGHDLGNAEYCLVREGVLEAVYAPDVLLVAPSINRTDVTFAGWWPSHVEQAAETILAFWNTWTYNASYHTRGMLAEFILGISGNVHDDDIDAFTAQLRSATQGADRAWQPPIMPLPDGQTIQKIDLKPNNRDMMFETWLSLLIAMTCAVYRMAPSTINARPLDGGASPGLNAPNREKEIALAKEEGLQSDVQHLVDGILNPIVREIHPDLRVLFEYGDFDPEKEARINEILVRTVKTRNEIRLAAGDQPQGFYLSPEDYDGASDEDKQKHDDNLWNMPADPGFANMMNQRKMMEQMGGQQPDGFGGDQGEDDGFGGQAQQFPFGQMPGAGQPPGPGKPPGAAPQPGAGGPPAGPGPKPPGGMAPMQKGVRRRPRVSVVYVRSDDQGS